MTLSRSLYVSSVQSPSVALAEVPSCDVRALGRRQGPLESTCSAARRRPVVDLKIPVCIPSLSIMLTCQIKSKSERQRH